MPGENDGQSTNTQTTDPGANGQQPSGDGSQPAGGTIMTGRRSAEGDRGRRCSRWCARSMSSRCPRAWCSTTRCWLATSRSSARPTSRTRPRRSSLNQWATDQAAQAKSADEQLVAQHEKWVEGVTKDPEIGGNNLPDTRKFSQAALARFGTPELKNYQPHRTRESSRTGAGLRQDRTGDGRGHLRQRQPQQGRQH